MPDDGRRWAGRYDHVVRRAFVSALLAATVSLVPACSDDKDGAATKTGHTPTTGVPSDAKSPRVTATDLAQKLGCTDFVMLPESSGPIDGGSARTGVTCALGSATLDVFERAFHFDASEEERLEHIKWSVGARDNVDRTTCLGYVLVSDMWFALSSDRETLDEVGAKLGGATEEVLPVSHTLCETTDNNGSPSPLEANKQIKTALEKAGVDICETQRAPGEVAHRIEPCDEDTFASVVVVSYESLSAQQSAPSKQDLELGIVGWTWHLHTITAGPSLPRDTLAKLDRAMDALGAKVAFDDRDANK